MRKTKSRPFSVGEILTVEFLEPAGITSETLADAMGVHSNTISDLVNGGPLTPGLAARLAVALGNTPEFWLNVQYATNVWDARNCHQEEAKLVKQLLTSSSEQ